MLGGKAAPGYHTAKQIIKLICHVAEMINQDRNTKDILKVIFLPNYRVSLAEHIFPAADVSEQISTAGYEASGTSNMKFTLNGALTVGTLDGANIEIMEEVGRDNIFIFGLNAEEIIALSQNYRPFEYYRSDPILKMAIDFIHKGFFNPEDVDYFKSLTQKLINEDRYLVLADFAAYHNCQKDVDRLYREPEEWTRRSILNVARVGKFSSDRTILEYNRDIWHAQPIKIMR
jgi:starch phosphorylase